MWKDAERAPEAAEIMGITAKRHLELGLIDEIIPEPLGSAYRDVEQMAATIKTRLISTLNTLMADSIETLLINRYNKYMAMGLTYQEK